jgi:hypothetical protein
MLDNLVNSLGTLPVKLLEYNLKLVSETMSPIDVGIYPFILLVYTLNSTNFVNLPISDGIVPVRLFEYNLKMVNETMSPIDVGIFPFILLV